MPETATTPTPKERLQQQQHRSSQRKTTPVNVETPSTGVSIPPLPSEVSPVQQQLRDTNYPIVDLFEPPVSRSTPIIDPFKSPPAPSPPATSYSSRRPMPSEREDTTSTHHFRPMTNSNQYAPPTAPQYSPPPPPPRPAKVPEQGDSQRLSVSPTDSTTFGIQDQLLPNGHRYTHSYPQQMPFGDADNYGQASMKKTGRKLPNYSKT